MISKKELPDIHGKYPEINLSLNKVGIVGLKMPIGYISLKNKPVIVVPTFDVFIDLPSSQKGIHTSRNYEVITDVLSKYVGKMYKLEDVSVAISKELLEKHEYATRSEVKAHGEAIFERETPKTRILSYEPFKMMAKAYAKRRADGSISAKRMIGIGLTGITACPCVKEVLKKISEKEIEKLGITTNKVRKIMNKIPMATHMQRAQSSIIIEIPDGVEMDAIRLVQIITDSMSSSTFEILKRSDEAELVLRAAFNLRFVEDCVRYMMYYVIRDFPDFPDSTYLMFKVRSMESIHQHDMVAKRKTTLGEIRNELNSNIETKC
ncbi:MAG: GTP cyclohydrolase MptA [Candidatus Methylarchaceae archaeon HK02M2]|nr:GTP cyclohydrolase MptA [Candidatus Methylarchaceae archaeon HK02M2]